MKPSRLTKEQIAELYKIRDLSIAEQVKLGRLPRVRKGAIKRTAQAYDISTEHLRKIWSGQRLATKRKKRK